MRKPEQVPDKVKEAVEQWMKNHPQVTCEPKLIWDALNGCYGFWYDNIFFGIELDGYIHT